MNGHTTADTHALGDHAEDRQPRERAVPCLACTTSTWHLSGYCDRHYQPPRQPARVVTGMARSVALVAFAVVSIIAIQHELARWDGTNAVHDPADCYSLGC